MRSDESLGPGQRLGLGARVRRLTIVVQASLWSARSVAVMGWGDEPAVYIARLTSFVIYVVWRFTGPRDLI